jgi:hypothetical protein
VIDSTLVRGRVVYTGGTVVGDRGWGRQARPGLGVAGQPVATQPVAAAPARSNA